MKIETGQTIWIKYYDGKAYQGNVISVEESDLEGILITVLTDTCGYRTVTESMCSLTKPSRKELQLR
tara:strand:- start:638 stop:838 length:201 start_codon:yes stop_codon:yes gene_type:complete